MNPKETAKKEVEKLVKKYELLLQEGRVNQYQEANTRKDFILPLFSALGWEITNIDEVDEETAVSRGRVDYSFKLSGVARFYLEAKALKADLDKQEYAEQAIDYAYNKGVPWAVLTDFEKIKLFNAEWKAKTLRDSQFLEIAYNEYLNRFDELWLLSKESLTQGLLDKEAERRLKKDKKQPISRQILADLLKAREKLTKNILQHSRLNKISEEELDEAVQRILDRLIFIRTCEDRNLEQNRLSSAKRLWQERGEHLKGGNLWLNLKKIFRDFDNGYNSKLFEEHLCENLTIDDEILAEIIQNLYQTPDGSRYDFSAISADVLGNIYEQYLGHILKKTSKSARLKETYQHRKEMGIYYTPTYIVDYIVKNTLGEILKKAKPKNVNKIKVLDPACGSGSFLIRAFDEFVNYWQKNSPGEFGYFRKIEILKNNLYGVDLDKQAVEITQMNLLLKTLYHRERLPMLEHIKQGNSLISGSEEELKKYFADNWQSKHPFNWNDEFKEIMSAGGFDVVIGNPPYVRVDNLDEKDKLYWKEHCNSPQGKYNIYYLFIESAFMWLKNGGFFGFIVPNKFCAASSAKKLREIIITNSIFCDIISVSHLDVFKDAANYPVILIGKKGKNIKEVKMSVVLSENEFLRNQFVTYSIEKKDFRVVPDQIFSININQKELDLVIRLLKNNEKLLKYLKTSEGLRIPETMEEKNIANFEIVKQFQFDKWSRISKGNYISAKNLHKVISPKSERYVNILKEKIVIAEDALSITSTIDDKKRIPQGGIYFGVSTEDSCELKYILGLLNSKLLSFVYRTLFGGMHMGGGYLRYRTEFLEQLPIRIISKSEQQFLIKLVDRMLDLNKQLQKFGDKLTDERKKIESEIQKTDQEIDEMVYELYGLTDEEIKIIEENV